MKEFHGWDLIILGNFKAKLGDEYSTDLAVGFHSRGRRNVNGDYFHQLFSKNMLIAPNISLKHKACHIITIEQKRESFTIFNWIDYILARQCRKY